MARQLIRREVGVVVRICGDHAARLTSGSSYTISIGLYDAHIMRS